MIKSKEARDFELALELYEQDNCFGLTENAILPKNKDKENYKPRTLIDQTLELIDPTPNIHTLFVQFNERFFWNILLPVEVKWSVRMTSCAGICSFHPRNRQCVIALSAPLLKLRPRKDLVETLLHEMIHGYLFLTNNNRDRDGHGPEFCKHMDRINKVAGTKITIYHSFHDEVKLYKQHWWRCNGPCQKRAPYFGTVRRAMNRAPGPNDFWWKEHQQTCGGQFIKIKEPENFKKKASKQKVETKPISKSNNSTNSMFNWLTKPTSSITAPTFTSTLKNIKSPSNTQNSLNGFKKLGTNTNVHGWSIRGPTGFDSSQKSITTSISTSTPKNIKSASNTQNSLSGFKKLGTNTNNVHGWGTGGPTGTNNSQKSATSVSGTPKFSSFGTLGGSNTGRSNLLSKFDINNKHQESSTYTKIPKKTIDTFIGVKAKKPTISNNQLSNEIKLVECPICSNFVPNNDINKHIDCCLIRTDNLSSTKSQVKADNSSFTPKRKINTSIFSSKQPKLDKSENLRAIDCPVCNKSFEFMDIHEHIDKCLSEVGEQDNSTIKLDGKNKTKDESIISVSSTSSNSSSSSITEDLKDFYPNSTSRVNNEIEATLQKCLVCNMLIPPETSLSDHLEDCIGNVFSDDSSLITDCDNKETSETASELSLNQNDKYPCPVCMQLISESFMNQHLDICLKST